MKTLEAGQRVRMKSDRKALVTVDYLYRNGEWFVGTWPNGKQDNFNSQWWEPIPEEPAVVFKFGDRVEICRPCHDDLVGRKLIVIQCGGTKYYCRDSHDNSFSIEPESLKLLPPSDPLAWISEERLSVLDLLLAGMKLKEDGENRTFIRECIARKRGEL